MFWNAVEQFKSISSERVKQELFFKITKTYIVIGSCLELNVPRKDYNIPNIMSLYGTYRKNRASHTPATPTKFIDNFLVPPDVFSALQVASEQNMVDTFSRFYLEYAKEMENELSKV